MFDWSNEFRNRRDRQGVAKTKGSGAKRCERQKKAHKFGNGTNICKRIGGICLIVEVWIIRVQNAASASYAQRSNIIWVRACRSWVTYLKSRIQVTGRWLEEYCFVWGLLSLRLSTEKTDESRNADTATAAYLRASIIDNEFRFWHWLDETSDPEL